MIIRMFKEIKTSTNKLNDVKEYKLKGGINTCYGIGTKEVELLKKSFWKIVNKNFSYVCVCVCIAMEINRRMGEVKAECQGLETG